jgi:HlyD family secretion protein
MRSILQKLGKKKVVLSVIGILIIGIAVYYFAFANRSGSYQFVTVKTGKVVQSVSVTGNTTPVQSVDLAFENGGTIAAVNADVGVRVTPGSVIARLDTRDLEAQLAQAQATIDTQIAKLKALQAGNRPADIQASQAALAKGRQDLSNMYTSISDTLADSYAKANDAVRSQLFSFFSNPESSSPQLTFSLTNSQTLNNVQTDRLNSSIELNVWRAELASSTATTPPSVLDVQLTNAISHLAVMKQLFADAAQALVEATNLSATTITAYKTSLATGLNAVNTASTNLSTLNQNIASQKFLVAQRQAELNLKMAGSTPEDIQGQQAQVAQAQASAQSIQVKIAKSALVSPFAGVVSVNNTKVGKIATAGTVLVSVISDNNLEIDANIPEVDIGRVSVGNAVNVTFDAFPNETFTGKIFYMDPAQTVTQGVVAYKIKVALDKTDPRVRSGLTANLIIKNKEKNNVLVLPQFAILQTDKGNFVQVLENGKPMQKPVTLGIRDQNGNTEILSGVSEGQQVLNIGLK